MVLLILIYLLVFLGTCSYSLAALATGGLSPAFEPMRVALACCATAGIGGCLYCLRAVYINKCVRQNWDPAWSLWYFIRPVTSFICGGASFLFLKAGLLILESKTQANASEIGFYALAFVAGLNVDKFVSKIEDVAHAVWGIERSRAGTTKEKTNA